MPANQIPSHSSLHKACQDIFDLAHSLSCVAMFKCRYQYFGGSYKQVSIVDWKNELDGASYSVDSDASQTQPKYPSQYYCRNNRNQVADMINYDNIGWRVATQIISALEQLFIVFKYRCGFTNIIPYRCAKNFKPSIFDNKYKSIFVGLPIVTPVSPIMQSIQYTNKNIDYYSQREDRKSNIFGYQIGDYEIPISFCGKLHNVIGMLSCPISKFKTAQYEHRALCNTGNSFTSRSLVFSISQLFQKSFIRFWTDFSFSHWMVPLIRDIICSAEAATLDGSYSTNENVNF